MKKILLMLGILLSVCQMALAQSALRGRVTDDKGTGLGDVAVKVQGTARGVFTDDAGYFAIVANSGDILVITSSGFRKVEVPAENGMLVKLTEDRKQVGEVVVTALQVKKEKKSLGYGTTTLSGATLTQGRDRSMLSGIAGKVAGVNITNTSGSPGSGTRVVIRGGTSITGNNQALIVVDGVPIDNSNTQNGGDNLNNQVDQGNRANDINPDDIESMSVLKGPAASALFGSRGANGAIIITTKRGKGAGKKGASVTYTTNIGGNNILMYPKFQNDWGQGYGGQTHTEENWSWGPKFDGLNRPWGNVVNGQQKVKPFVALPNNVREFFRNGTVWENGLSVGSSTQNSNIYLSLNNLRSTGIVDNSGYNRTGVRLNMGHDLASNLKVSAGVNYTKVGADLFAGGQANNSFYDQIYQTPRDIPTLELADIDNPFNDLEGYYGAYTINPYFVLKNYKTRNEVNRLIGNVDFTWKPFNWLTLLNRTTNDAYTDGTEQYQPRYNFTRPDYDIDIKELGNYQEDITRYNELNNDIMASTEQKLADGLNLRALAGFNVRQTTFNSVGTEITGGIVANDWLNLDNSADGYLSTNSKSMRRWMGLYSDLGFSYKDYLFLNVTGRNDWSSTLPTNRNSYFYPSANMAFVITDFLKSRNETWTNKYLSYAKLRIASARVGNDPGAYLLRPTFLKAALTDGRNNSQITFPFNGVPAVTLQNGLANDAIKPEINTENEIGTELGFFNNRLTVDFSLYRRVGRNQIIPVSLGGSSGYSSATLNAGNIRNQGVELAVSGTPIITKGKTKFRLDLFGTYTKNNSLVVALDEAGTLEQVNLGGLAGTSVVAAKGLPYGQIYGRGMERDPNGNIIVDGNGMPILTSENKYFGTYNPDWMGSIGTDMSYGNLKLHLLFFRKQGGVMFSRLKNIMEFVGTSSTTAYNDRADFVVPNSVVENPDGTFSPNTTKVNAETFWTEQSNDELSILPATFTKLREASLSYSLPSKLIQKTKLGGVTFGVYGNNLLLWLPTTTNMFGQVVNTITDPEISGFGTGNVQGIEFGTVPSLRNYGVNLKVQF
jgi:TonB-linked SusC/RagA family outer membrane protein